MSNLRAFGHQEEPQSVALSDQSGRDVNLPQPVANLAAATEPLPCAEVVLSLPVSSSLGAQASRLLLPLGAQVSRLLPPSEILNHDPVSAC